MPHDHQISKTTIFGPTHFGLENRFQPSSDMKDLFRLRIEHTHNSAASYHSTTSGCWGFFYLTPIGWTLEGGMSSWFMCNRGPRNTWLSQENLAHPFWKIVQGTGSRSNKVISLSWTGRPTSYPLGSGNTVFYISEDPNGLTVRKFYGSTSSRFGVTEYFWGLTLHLGPIWRVPIFVFSEFLEMIVMSCEGTLRLSILIDIPTLGSSQTLGSSPTE